MTDNTVNGIDVTALRDAIEAIKEDLAKGHVSFHVTTRWTGQTSSESRPTKLVLDGEEHTRDFAIVADEPPALLGQDKGINPQEVLMSALNACMLVGYVVGAAVRGITLTKLEIETEGALDLRGFLGIDPEVKPGYDSLRYTVRMAGDGTAEQFQAIHDTVVRTSPNRFNLAMPVNLEASLVVEDQAKSAA